MTIFGRGRSRSSAPYAGRVRHSTHCWRVNSSMSSPWSRARRQARDNSPGPVDLANPAVAAGAPVMLPTTRTNRASLLTSVAVAPDLLVVVGRNQSIRPELVAVPRRGCVRSHASLLPHHHGHAPVNWAILRGETTTDNTMIMLDHPSNPGGDSRIVHGLRRDPVREHSRQLRGQRAVINQIGQQTRPDVRHHPRPVRGHHDLRSARCNLAVTCM
jgi:Formyl transferase